MTGKELFDQHQNAALRNGFGSDEFRYGNLLFEALKIEGEEKIFRLLEEATTAGKRIALVYSSGIKDDPDRVVLM